MFAECKTDDREGIAVRCLRGTVPPLRRVSDDLTLWLAKREVTADVEAIYRARDVINGVLAIQEQVA